jgi:hypothetical protein
MIMKSYHRLGLKLLHWPGSEHIFKVKVLGISLHSESRKIRVCGRSYHVIDKREMSADVRD